MHTQKDIQFDHLISQVKRLSDVQRKILKAELDRLEANSDDNSLEEFLLSAPTFSENQIKTIEETRKAIDQWRKN
ncbi:hypothetical protein GCM10007423_34010 [Dyadobacter endophyticus]|uniref:Uncharacterized protein n=1 Tax=Dyadobacter endophyticus TaxID=1749036 RepID=A0ABQ1YX10_9BACT|nr:hypothetical protein [Dyadobacter endophyticus]GGH39527.1 hypothetical protein GCM10007423_34010 [Dyadobacter endophyticus]